MFVDNSPILNQVEKHVDEKSKKVVESDNADILRAVGDSRKPLIVLVISCFVNIALDVLFVITFGMGKRGDVPGVTAVAVATILCQLLSALIICGILMKSTGSYKLNIRSIRLNPEIFVRIIRIGLPAAFQSTMYRKI